MTQEFQPEDLVVFDSQRKGYVVHDVVDYYRNTKRWAEVTNIRGIESIPASSIADFLDLTLEREQSEFNCVHESLYHLLFRMTGKDNQALWIFIASQGGIQYVKPGDINLFFEENTRGNNDSNV